jgi:hypothetical protein
MPVVRYGNRKVATEALAGVRKQAAATPTSEGVGLAQAQGEQAREVGQLGATVTALATQQFAESRKRAADVRLLNAERQMDDWERQLLHDPKTGAFHVVKGKDALGLTETVGGEYDQLTSVIEQSLNPRQRGAFRIAQHHRRGRLLKSLELYAGDEFERFETSETQAAIVGSQQLAIANTAIDATRIGVELERTEKMITTYADHKAVGPNVRQQMLVKARTEIHAGVITQLLARGDDADAQHYFDKFKDRIDQIDPHSRRAARRAQGSGPPATSGKRTGRRATRTRSRSTKWKMRRARGSAIRRPSRRPFTICANGKRASTPRGRTGRKPRLARSGKPWRPARRSTRFAACRNI